MKNDEAAKKRTPRDTTHHQRKKRYNAKMDRETLVAWLGKTKTAAHRTVTARLKAVPLDSKFADPHLAALAKFHPKKKFGAPELTFTLSARPPYYTKSLFVEARTGGWIECSWVKCLANLYGKFDADRDRRAKALSALRNDAFASGAMAEARERYANGGGCAACGETHRRLDIDHDGKPFAQIVDEFLEANGALELGTLKVKYARSAACFSLAGRALRKRWQEHHDAEAVLKGVCHACNCSKGSGGYRHKRKTKED